MSLSRLALSSPFDAVQRPRTAPSRQNGDRKRVKEGGSSLASSNIMVDTRVVRRSQFNVSIAQMQVENDEQQPGCILFDSRLIKGDVFANPVVTVTTSRQSSSERWKHPRSRRLVGTPPPVKGRRHASVQTDSDADFT